MNAFANPISVPSSHPYRGGNGVLDVLGQDGLPFQVRRAFRIALVPPGAERAGHAHRTCSQILWSVSGQWHVRIETRPGATVLPFELDEGREALLVPPGNWLTLTSSTRLDVMVVLCSEPYLEASYVRDRATWEREWAERSALLDEAARGPIRTMAQAKLCEGRVVVLLIDNGSFCAGERFVVDAATSCGAFGVAGARFQVHRADNRGMNVLPDELTPRSWVDVPIEWFRLEGPDPSAQKILSEAEKVVPTRRSLPIVDSVDGCLEDWNHDIFKGRCSQCGRPTRRCRVCLEDETLICASCLIDNRDGRPPHRPDPEARP